MVAAFLSDWMLDDAAVRCVVHLSLSLFVPGTGGIRRVQSMAGGPYEPAGRQASVDIVVRQNATNTIPVLTA
jgi:hypothetical protein